MGAPNNIAHADWGTDPRKRQIAVAELVDDHNYRVTDLRPADPLKVAKGDLRGCAHLGGPPSGQLLIGFDFPIGVPAAYARAAGIDFFPDLLTQIGIPPWDRFADVAATPAEISLHRPFYPSRPGGTQRAHLSAALGLTASEMRRRCDGRDAETMFWTLGGKQVGKAALSGWKCLSSAPPG